MEEPCRFQKARKLFAGPGFVYPWESQAAPEARMSGAFQDKVCKDHWIGCQCGKDKE
jgi:hypothetical protein